MIEIDGYGRAYTKSFEEAKKYRIADQRPIEFVQSDYLKNKYRTEGRWINTFTFKSPQFYLPPAFGKTVAVRYPIYFDIDVEFWGHQTKALEYVKGIYNQGGRSAMVISGTGSGKSNIMLGVVKTLGMSTVIVVPTTTIAKGLFDTFKFYIDVRIIKGSKATEYASVNIMTHQTFNRIYNDINGKFDLLICDEGHHLPQRRIDQFNLWKGAFIFTTTATPDRKEFSLDGFKHIMGNVHDTETQALPVKVLAHDFRYNYSNKELMEAGEGLSPESPEIYRRLMIKNTIRTDEMLKLVMKLYNEGHRKFIIFSDRVEHVKAIATQARKLFHHVYEFMGDSDKAAVMEEFDKHDHGIIVGNLQCCGEGFNIPSLEVGVLFVSTQWTVTVDQAVGRVRRKFGSKTHGVLIDFIDTMQFDGSKPKKLGWYGRKKIYASKERALQYI